MTAELEGTVDKAFVPALLRAALILDELATQSEGIGISELARRLSLPKSSVMNICNTLVETKLARRRRDGGFSLGSKLVQLGAAYLSNVGIGHEFHDVCLEWPTSLEETVQLAVLAEDDLSVVYLARRDGTQPVRLASEIGRRLPATCTAVGRAILASLPEPELRARIPRSGRLATLTPNSIRTVAELHQDLERVRSAGYALDDEQAMEGVVCVAAAVPRSDHDTDRAAVCFTLLKARASPERLTRLSRDIRLMATELAGRLGSTQR